MSNDQRAEGVEPEKAARIMEATRCYESVAHFMLGRHDGSVEDAVAELWRIYDEDEADA